MQQLFAATISNMVEHEADEKYSFPPYASRSFPFGLLESHDSLSCVSVTKKASRDSGGPTKIRVTHHGNLSFLSGLGWSNIRIENKI